MRPKGYAMSDTQFHVMLNASSGTALAGGVGADQVVEQFGRLGHRISIDADSNRPFERRLMVARNKSCAGAGGGGR